MSAAATWSAPSANCRLADSLALLVADEQTERARELILAYNAAAPLAEEPPEPCGPGSLLC